MKKINLNIAITISIALCLCTIHMTHAQIITTIAGNGTPGFSGDGGAATAAKMRPWRMAVDGSGTVYITDAGNHRVRKVSASGIITTIAGTGTAGFSGDGGAATAADLNYPDGIAVDGSSNIYVTDNGNSRIRKISTSGIITTIAGTGTSGYGGDGGAATAADLGDPTGLAVDGSGNVYIVDRGNHRIRKVNASGIINTVAGTGSLGYSGDGGDATAADLFYPHGVAVDGSGNIYIADYGNDRIRKVNTSGGISTIAGSGTRGYSGDGAAATAADLNNPYDVKVDGSGNIYIADYGNYRIRKVDASNIVSTFAGTGSGGYSGDGGPATAANLYHTTGLATDGSALLYIGDANNFRVRSVGICSLPSAGSISGTSLVCAGSTTTLTTTATGGSWSSGSATIATISSSGVVTGLSAGFAVITYSVTNGCGTATATYSVTVNPLPDAGVISGIDSVCPGHTITLADAASGGAWFSGTPLIASVGSTGVITGVASGTASIMYIVSNSCGIDTAFYTVHVRSAAACATGIGSTENGTVNGIAVYPNPTSDHISIVSTINLKAVLKTVDGRVVMEQISARELNIGHLPEGMYLLLLSNEIGQVVKVEKVVKE